MEYLTRVNLLPLESLLFLFGESRLESVLGDLEHQVSTESLTEYIQTSFNKGEAISPNSKVIVSLRFSIEGNFESCIEHTSIENDTNQGKLSGWYFSYDYTDIQVMSISLYLFTDLKTVWNLIKKNDLTGVALDTLVLS